MCGYQQHSHRYAVRCARKFDGHITKRRNQTRQVVLFVAAARYCQGVLVCLRVEFIVCTVKTQSNFSGSRNFIFAGLIVD